MPDSIALLDEAGTITTVNEAWKRFGRENAAENVVATPTSTVGANYLEVCRAATNDVIAQQVLDGLQAILAGAGPSFTLEYPCHSPTQRRWFLLRAVPAPGGQPGAMVVHTDITARKLAEEEQVRLSNAAQAAERLAAQQAQRIDEFFTTAAHDIRNPVGVVMSHLQLALRRFEQAQVMAHGIDPTGHLDERLEAVHTNLVEASASADRLARLVTRLFDVARARAGVLHLELVPCDLTALVHEQVAAHRLLAPGRTIRVELPEPLRPIWALADADRLGLVLANYLTNALKYSADDRPVTVGLEMTTGRAMVSVRDEGPGLPWDEQSRVWEPFHRAPGVAVQSRVDPAAEYLGLGLYICRGIVEQHPSGHVGVESVEGQGSTFWFSLPLVAPDEASPDKAS